MRTLLRLICLAFLLVSANVAACAQDAGDFTFKYGFDAKTRPRREDEGSPAQKLSASFKIYVSPAISFTFANDNVVWKEPSGAPRVSGFGNSRLTFDADLITEDSTGVRSRPAVSIEYNLKLPTASKTKGLGTGRADHEIVGSIAKSFGETIIDAGKLRHRTNFEVDFGGYFAGNADRPGFTNTGELSLILTQTLDSLKVRKYKYRGEIDMFSAAKNTPSEIYSVNQLSINLSSKAVLRLGMRNGITPNSPRFAFYTSIALDGSFSKKKK